MTAELINYINNYFEDELTILLDLETCFSKSTNDGIISSAALFKINIVALMQKDILFIFDSYSVVIFSPLLVLEI